MSDVYVEVTSVVKTYRRGPYEVAALQHATCRVVEGDRIAVVGPSGSGKSTLLHLMGGLDLQTSGAINWPALADGTRLRPEYISFVFQSMSLLPSLTVLENIELPLMLIERTREGSKERAFQALRSMHLEHTALKLPEEISGGQAQRVAVARALCSGSKVILADEPTGQLDHDTSREMFDVLLESLEGSKTALVIATHDMSIADRMKSLWRIHHGELEDTL